LREIAEANQRREEIAEKDHSNYAQDVARERFKMVKKSTEAVVGAANVPKEDLNKAVDDHIRNRTTRVRAKRVA